MVVITGLHEQSRYKVSHCFTFPEEVINNTPRIQVLTEASVKITALQDTAPCSLIEDLLHSY